MVQEEPNILLPTSLLPRLDHPVGKIKLKLYHQTQACLSFTIDYWFALGHSLPLLLTLLGIQLELMKLFLKPEVD